MSAWLFLVLRVLRALRRAAWAGLAGLAAAGCASAVHAHQSGNSYLTVSDAAGVLTLQIDLSVKDLNAILKSPAGAEIEFDATALAAHRERLSQAVRERLGVQADGRALPLSFTAQAVVLRNDGLHLRQGFEAREAASERARPIGQLVLRYDFFSRDETVARAYAKLVLGGQEITAVFDSRAPVQRFALHEGARWAGIGLFLREGALHIWGGPDHLLFLLCLLLPGLALVGTAAAQPPGTAGELAPTGSHHPRPPASLQPPHRPPLRALRPALRPALWFAFSVVTAFTVAHSITLAAAALGWVQLPEKWVEAVIALSIIVCAVLNLVAVGRRWHWQLGFGFGLVHGLGFANGLRELGLSHGHFVETLLAFNVGVELGQLAVLVAVCVLLWPWWHRPWVRTRLTAWGSAMVLPIAGVWLAQRLLA